VANQTAVNFVAVRWGDSSILSVRLPFSTFQIFPHRIRFIRRLDLISSQVIPKFGLRRADFLAPHDRMPPSITAWPVGLSSSGLKKIIVAFSFLM
jgi:hypothetical protein